MSQEWAESQQGAAQVGYDGGQVGLLLFVLLTIVDGIEQCPELAAYKRVTYKGVASIRMWLGCAIGWLLVVGLRQMRVRRNAGRNAKPCFNGGL